MTDQYNSIEFFILVADYVQMDYKCKYCIVLLGAFTTLPITETEFLTYWLSYVQKKRQTAKDWGMTQTWWHFVWRRSEDVYSCHVAACVSEVTWMASVLPSHRCSHAILHPTDIQPHTVFNGMHRNLLNFICFLGEPALASLISSSQWMSIIRKTSVKQPVRKKGDK